MNFNKNESLFGVFVKYSLTQRTTNHQRANTTFTKIYKSFGRCLKVNVPKSKEMYLVNLAIYDKIVNKTNQTSQDISVHLLHKHSSPLRQDVFQVQGDTLKSDFYYNGMNRFRVKFEIYNHVGRDPNHSCSIENENQSFNKCIRDLYNKRVR